MKRLALIAALGAGPVAADPALLDFMGGQGCTYGPETRAAAVLAGLDEIALVNFMIESEATGLAERYRDWVVLSEEICTIRFPDLAPELALSDPDVEAAITVVEAVEDLGGEGCFLYLDTQILAESRGWDLDRAERARWQLIAQGIISGEIRFHESSFLRTPITFQVLTGPCANVPTVEPIMANHDAVARNFGPYLRGLMQYVPCDETQTPERLDGQIASELQGMSILDAEAPDPSFNAWATLEYYMIALAAGWIEGASYTERGTPRPPMCHYRE